MKCKANYFSMFTMMTYRNLKNTSLICTHLDRYDKSSTTLPN